MEMIILKGSYNCDIINIVIKNKQETYYKMTMVFEN